MKGKLVVCAQATAELFRGSLPGDEFALITFAAKPRVAVPWTADARAIGEAWRHERAAGTTALLDTVLFGAEYARHAHNPRRIVLVISDGGDNRSRYSRGEVRRRIE